MAGSSAASACHSRSAVAEPCDRAHEMTYPNGTIGDGFESDEQPAELFH
jgi:hypothetical protein